MTCMYLDSIDEGMSSSIAFKQKQKELGSIHILRRAIYVLFDTPSPDRHTLKKKVLSTLFQILKKKSFSVWDVYLFYGISRINNSEVLN